MTTAPANTENRTANPLAQEWWTRASCRQTPDAQSLFFSEELGDISAAKRICAECPVIAECLEGALLRSEPCGVWGGQLFERGRVQLIKRRRGRPRKVPLPEEIFAQVPIPAELQQLIA